MSRQQLIAGNWKMNLGMAAARELAAAIASGIPAQSSVEVAVFPPFPWLLPVREALEASSVKIGAQNSYSAPAGAFTGEVSASMLTEVVDYVIIGHSERRHVFGESDSLIAEKSVAVLSNGLGLILCVGETLEERERGDAESVVSRQLSSAVEAIMANHPVESLTIAYEPVWAIGTGVAATSEDAQQMCLAIRNWLRENLSAATADDSRILYGGSVSPDNASELLSQADIDGALVGGASLKAESFLRIVSAADAVAGL